MSYKTIGIVLTDEVRDLAAFDTAMGMAERNSGHLDVFCLGYDPVRYDMVPMGSAPAMTYASSGEAQARAREMTVWAESKLKGAMFGNTVRPLVVTSVGLDNAIARTVRFADLIVASQPYVEGSSQLQVSVLEAALFGTGAPVLIVPRDDNRAFSSVFERPLVAWNESHESLGAIRKALPALREADHTEIVMIDPPSHSAERSDPGGAVCVMLSRHGIKAEVSIISKTLPRVADVLNRHAADHSCDLIVMGAYGHSRFRQALMGGATRDMLEAAKLPVLMAH